MSSVQNRADVISCIISAGHCKPICPCYMNGVSYDHGDRWQKTGDPCTTYECGNGMYIPVIQGIAI